MEGDGLKINVSSDFETQTQYSVRLSVIDGGGLSFEKAFELTVLDINPPIPAGFTAGESIGSVNLLKDAQNLLYAQDESGAPIPLKYLDQPYDNRFSEWRPLGAETLNGENQVLWENTGAGQLGLWRANENWDWQLSDSWASLP